MAESSLSVGYPELCAEVGFYLGYGRTAAGWSTEQAGEIDGVVQSGVRRVYYPMATDINMPGYEWSFLRPTTTLALVAATGDYDMPDDFGRLVGGFTFAPDEHRRGVAEVAIGDLLAMRCHAERSDAPAFAATRYKASDGAAGQRQEALFYPEPDKAYTLYYEYEAYNGALSDTYPYPLGGMQLAELYIESCLAVAEQRLNDDASLHTSAYKSLLLDAIARDKRRGAKNFGQMGHREKGYCRPRHGDTGGVYPITYHGEEI